MATRRSIRRPIMHPDIVAAHFADPKAAAHYAEGPPRLVPGFADLHRMSGILLAERAPENARVLVLGAGGGLELKAFATAQPGWSFDGVDPADAMLQLAARTLGPLALARAPASGLYRRRAGGPVRRGGLPSDPAFSRYRRAATHGLRNSAPPQTRGAVRRRPCQFSAGRRPRAMGVAIRGLCDRLWYRSRAGGRRTRGGRGRI